MEKEQIIKWLKDGKEHASASILSECEFELDYFDTGFALGGGPDIDMFCAKISCPRKILDSLDDLKNEVREIEDAIHKLAASISCHVKDINWVALGYGGSKELPISNKSISSIGDIITGDKKLSQYRSGSLLVEFFNNYLPNDVYKSGFPSRWMYAEEKLRESNKLGQIRKVIEHSVDPREYFDTEFKVEEAVGFLNKYLDYDGFELVLVNNLYKLQGKSELIVETQLFNKSHELNMDYISEHLEKCDNKIKEEDYSGAITNARSLLENILLELEEVLKKPDKKYSGDLNKLYGRVFKLLNLDPSKKEISAAMREIFSGLISIVNGLAGLRNSASDAHGARYNPSLHHAKLAVNSSKTISDFLVESFSYQVKNGFIRLEFDGPKK